MFRKFLISAAIALCSLTAVAATQIDTNGLNDAQIAELKAHAAKIVADTAKAADGQTEIGPMVTMATTWGNQAAQAAEGFAKAINIAARELGVTVNEFLKTDAGKLTAVLIVWKVAGASIAHGLYGVLFLTVGLTMLRVMYVRLFTSGYKEVQYSNLFGMFTGTKMVRIPKSVGDLKFDGEWMSLWIMIIASIAILGFGSVFF